MAFGFLLILVFNTVAITWDIVRTKAANRGKITTIWISALGIVCVILLMGDKVLLDEIGRETRLGWETLGEWIILYILLTVQLVFCIAVAVRVLRSKWLEDGRGR
jgi:hypothetical protein